VTPSKTLTKATASVPKAVSQIEPYKFEVGKIELSAAETEVNKSVSVTLPVKNVGSETNIYRAALTVNGENKGTKDITLKPGDSGNLKYDLNLNKEGTYSVAIADIAATLEVYRAEDIQIVVPELFEQAQTSFSITSPKYPFIIRSIEFRSPLPDSFKIIDSEGKELYSARVSTSVEYVPDIVVGNDFNVILNGSYSYGEVQSCGAGCGFVVITHYTGVAYVSGIHKVYAP
jgi:hypothetical protein